MSSALSRNFQPGKQFWVAVSRSSGWPVSRSADIYQAMLAGDFTPAGIAQTRMEIQAS